jgi:hypothetical protein
MPICELVSSCQDGNCDTQDTRDIQHGKDTQQWDTELALRHEGYSRAEDAGRHRKIQEKGDIKQSEL